MAEPLKRGADYTASVTVQTSFWAKNYLDAVNFAIKIGVALQSEALEVDGENCSGLTVIGLDVEETEASDERDD